ncbi:hypothetical protein AFCDBAGC_2317 [Methylobacterium cerastii]|uniref:Glycosyltransferase RgtA/B/C/D-like domain-containing protein n=1 Tax=Methylobacterium cerastii TaxID=932741 RepID=A0ABQ4QHU0_9HYPH|nr:MULTISPECIES: hypothetical protein [Methylobacterium]TXN82497.1 hypothetical protein FV234_09765 [Methylobacterium sp. WL8]GJD44450.1 hypothetical protein AFCDBAGC_2317 [Methylobacterium cerastii]
MAATASFPAAPPAGLHARKLLWLLVLFCVVTLYPPGDVIETIRHLRVPDTDDAMRLVEARDLAAGQGWYDNVQYRFLPPDGVPSHWSRLLDAPPAGLLLVLTPWVGSGLAEGLVAAFWPPLLLAVYATALFSGVRTSFGPRAAVLAVLAATQTFGVTVQFAAGRVDHHDVQMIAILGMATALIRGGARAGVAAGALAAFSLAIGLEGLPSVALGALFVVGDWVFRGRPALPCFLGFGLGLGLAAPLLFGAQTAPHLWTATACDALSPPWLWLAGGGGAAALACAGLDRRLGSIGARIAVVAAIGAVLVGGFALLFPICLGGPFPGMTPLVRDRWLLMVNEMTSVPKFVARRQWEMLVYYPVLALAAFAASWAAFRGAPEHRRAYGVAAVLLWPGLVIGWFQFRGIYVASGLIPLVAGPVLDRALALAGDRAAAPRRRAGLAALGIAMISTAWMAPAALAGLFEESGAAAASAEAFACQADAAVKPLAALPAGTVLAPVVMGPSILMRTPHAVVAAPYHRAIPGLTAAIEGLGGSEADLRRHVAAHGVRYVVVCRARPSPGLDGPAFATRLARGEVQADWLEPLPLGGDVLKVWRLR